jgi:hypothetical protein
MCANAQHDEPFGLLDAVGVSLWVAQGFDFDGFGVFDFGFGAVADEDGFAAPFDDYLLRERGNGLVVRVLKGKDGEEWGLGCLHFFLLGLPRGRLRPWLERGRLLMLTCLRGNLDGGANVSQCNRDDSLH